MFVWITQSVVPGPDKLDDPRHVLEASYCDAIVIEDQQFRRNANLINPDLKVIRLADLSESFGTKKRTSANELMGRNDSEKKSKPSPSRKRKGESTSREA
jgi:hypothetical protein